ncbi:hypothetical protein [Streptosporangium roseum]|uniref:hypothetical protein n=1 Tax=Streptosporangium roseum TaxID=2001 RepID=UPI0004CDAC04|nr:hypothetical protein [Streptosporangium roseum]
MTTWTIALVGVVLAAICSRLPGYYGTAPAAFWRDLRDARRPGQIAVRLVRLIGALALLTLSCVGKVALAVLAVAAAAVGAVVGGLIYLCVLAAARVEPPQTLIDLEAVDDNAVADVAEAAAADSAPVVAVASRLALPAVKENAR